MSHFYGMLQGSRGAATRQGTKKSGIRTTAASWKGCVKVRLFINDEGEDMFEVSQDKWEGAGVRETLAIGKIGEFHDMKFLPEERRNG